MLLAEKLSVTLGGKRILQHLDFKIQKGTWVGLLGPNGSGKTTLLRTLSGLLAYSGRLRLDGLAIRDWKPQELARQMAFVRQSSSLAFDFTVEQLVLLGRAPHKRWLEGYTRHDLRLAGEALDRLEMEGFSNRSVLSLSGGELQRVFLAQALVQEADWLLLDEPTAHLDVHHQFEFMNQVQQLVDDGRTVIAVFHDLEFAARYAQQLMVLNEGQLVSTGTPDEVLTESLIASVFRMRTELDMSDEGFLRIMYQSAL